MIFVIISFNYLSLAEDGNLEKIKNYLQNAMDKIPALIFISVKISLLIM